MNKVSHAIVKLRIPIFIIALVLVFPAAISYSRTKVNYDMLSYLPQDIDTMKGQNIMVGEFGSGAFSEIIVEGMTNKQVSALKEKVEKVGGEGRVGVQAGGQMGEAHEQGGWAPSG